MKLHIYVHILHTTTTTQGTCVYMSCTLSIHGFWENYKNVKNYFVVHDMYVVQTIYILYSTTTCTNPFRLDMEITCDPLGPYREISECRKKRAGWAILAGSSTGSTTVVLCSARPPRIFGTAITRERRPIIREGTHRDIHDLPVGLVLELETSFKRAIRMSVFGFDWNALCTPSHLKSGVCGCGGA